MNNECKLHIKIQIAIAMVVLVLGLFIYSIRIDTKGPPSTQTCHNIDKYVNTTQPIDISYPFVYLWHKRFWMGDLGYIGMQCPSSIFDTNYQMVFNNTDLIATCESKDIFGYVKIIKDCHNIPLVKTERFIFGKNLPGPLANYTIWFEISNPNEIGIYGYLVTEGIFDAVWKIVDHNGKILVQNERTTLTTQSFTIIDQTNPAGDPRVAAMMYVLVVYKTRDYCNESYLGALLLMILVLCFFVLYFTWFLLKFVFKKKNDNGNDENILNAEMAQENAI